MTQNVSVDECEEIRELHDEGIPQYRIGEAFDRSVQTVRRHIRGSCQHRGGGRRQTPDRSTLIDALHKLAAEIDRIPSRTDWDTWPDRPCDGATAKEVFGSWGDALEATEFPPLPEGAPVSIRAAAYQKPELCTIYD